jgi:nitrogen-specific signal transduction histidine kinase
MRHGGSVVVAASLDGIDSTTRQLRQIDLVVSVVVLLVLAGVGAVIVRASLRPLVEDLLLLARLDQQRPLDRHPVDLLALAADAVHDARAVAPDRRIELVVGGEDGDPAGPALVVLGDDERLRQVLANLVNNALTHTPAGGPI